MTKVIVSYSRKDSIVARKLIEAFKQMDLDVWVDWEDIPPAVGWLDQILRGIEESDAFIFLVSPDSVISEVCSVEVGHAGKNNKRIIPIVLRDVDPKSVNSIIRDLNWIFGREQDDFEECLAKIKLAIELDIEWVGEHRRLQVRALEWHRKKDISLLLRGRDLRYARTMVKSASTKNPTPTELQHLYMHHSRRNENLRYSLWALTAVIVFMMIGLSWTAWSRYQLAAQNEALALEKQQLADENAAVERQNAVLALEAKDVAEVSENIAQAQRSAAKAQIYQARPGELYTSTLLAIDSAQRLPSLEAEEILRKNISLLPIPVAQMAQDDGINAIEFSPLGDVFVTASADHTACLLNVRDGAKIFCATSSGSVNDAAFSPDGAVIATGDSLGQVLILDALTGEVQNTYNYGVTVWDVNVSPDGESLAIARDDGRITFIDLNTREFKFELSTQGSLHVSEFSPDGAWIAAGSNIGSVTLWNLIDRRILSGPAHKGQVLTLAFSPDNLWLVSGAKDSTAILAQTETGEELFRVLNEDWVEDAAFSPDSSWFVTVSDDHRIRVWDSENGDERLRILQDGLLTEVKVSWNGQWIATTGSDQTIRVWNAATGAEIFQIPLENSGSVLGFSQDERYLVSGDEGGAIHIWDISEMLTPVNSMQFEGFTSAVQFSPSGGWLAASDENRVWLLDEGQFSTLTTPPQSGLILELRSSIKALLISPDAKWIGVSAESGDLVLYGVESGKSRTMRLGDPALNFVFSGDGEQLVTAGLGGKVQTWDPASGDLIRTVYETDRSILSLAGSQTSLAIGMADQIVVMDLENEKIMAEIQASGDHTLMALNADASLLASSNSFGQIQVWGRDVEGFELIQSIPSGQAFSVTFNPMGDRLLVGATSVLYVFDPLHEGELARIPHKDGVKDVSFSPDGKMLATTSVKAIQFWDVKKIPVYQADDLIPAACKRLIRNFDEDQWSALFGDKEYRVLCENLATP